MVFPPTDLPLSPSLPLHKASASLRRRRTAAEATVVASSSVRGCCTGGRHPARVGEWGSDRVPARPTPQLVSPQMVSATWKGAASEGEKRAPPQPSLPPPSSPFPSSPLPSSLPQKAPSSSDSEARVNNSQPAFYPERPNVVRRMDVILAFPTSHLAP